MIVKRWAPPRHRKWRPSFLLDIKALNVPPHESVAWLHRNQDHLIVSGSGTHGVLSHAEINILQTIRTNFSNIWHKMLFLVGLGQERYPDMFQQSRKTPSPLLLAVVEPVNDTGGHPVLVYYQTVLRYPQRQLLLREAQYLGIVAIQKTFKSFPRELLGGGDQLVAAVQTRKLLDLDAIDYVQLGLEELTANLEK